MNPKLDTEILKKEARVFGEIESKHSDPLIYGTTDGKAIGTYFEQKFRRYLQDKYLFEAGNSAKGIDFPDLEIDMKVTSINQPQSSCPFDDIQAGKIADELLAAPIEIGYLTISNALQWRLQYGRIIEKAGEIPGIQRIK